MKEKDVVENFTFDLEGIAVFFKRVFEEAGVTSG